MFRFIVTLTAALLASPALADQAPPAPAPAAPAAAMDYTGWHGILSAHVANQKVDYAAIKADPRFAEVLKQFAAVDPASLKTKDARLAYWINAYNAFAIEGVIRHLPGIKSVSEPYPDFGFFKRADFTAGGKKVALNAIENEIVRPTFKDPRIHAALNCASISCPPLLNAAFRPETLNAQLDQVFGAFVNDTQRNKLAADGTLQASEIFNWYKADFEPAGGVKSWFVKYHKDKAAAAKISAVSHLPYNWQLNRK